LDPKDDIDQKEDEEEEEDESGEDWDSQEVQILHYLQFTSLSNQYSFSFSNSESLILCFVTFIPYQFIYV
jgi:hypothetical protein